MSFESLNMAASALRAQRLSLDVAGRNLAGAAEPGYTRQVPVFSEEHSSPRGRYSQDVEGLGTSIRGIQRVRSGLLDGAYRARANYKTELEAPQIHQADLEARLAADPGLTSLFQDVDTALVQMQGAPGNLGLRQALFQQLGSAADQIRAYDQEMTDNASRAREDLGQQVGRANQLLAQLADLNPRVVASQPGTTGSNAMLDQQDRLLDELSALLDLQILRQPAGNVDLLVGGSQVLSLTRADTLVLQSDNTLRGGAGNPIRSAGGAIAALQKYVSQEVPAWRDQLDQLAGSWIVQSNDLHRRLYAKDGVSGRDLLSGSGSADVALALSDPIQLGHAVARIEGVPISTTAVVADQPLSSLAGSLLTPATASGSVQVNGTVINWDDTQSLQQVLDAFQAAGVRGQVQTQSGRVILERDPAQPGPADITISDLSGNLTQTLGLAGQPSRSGGLGDSAGLAALQQRMRSASYGASADRSLQQAFRDLQSDLGSSLQTRQLQGEAARSAADSAETARRSVAGVSSDEELLAVTRYQQAFAAAAKIATAADEMLTTLIQMGR